MLEQKIALHKKGLCILCVLLGNFLELLIDRGHEQQSLAVVLGQPVEERVLYPSSLELDPLGLAWVDLLQSFQLSHSILPVPARNVLLPLNL